ncbi:hypothetical protein [Pontibacter ramchanderi]|uniref:Uncharacterized protein n=1 Tax=Pontibacter ramchanderi TaxID=1179743 RepID=A0A2N3U8H8_9BACT|nr:hypothetical protein [Pontibacter ramchanderi]PKV63057.1 hypothetical protein BD749_2894 [Pontibacter ramchanderi]
MQPDSSHFISIQLGHDDQTAIFILDVSKLCFAYFKPETEQQTAKLVLDFGASQKIFEKQDAEQVYLALSQHHAFKFDPTGRYST